MLKSALLMSASNTGHPFASHEHELRTADPRVTRRTSEALQSRWRLRSASANWFAWRVDQLGGAHLKGNVALPTLLRIARNGATSDIPDRGHTAANRCIGPTCASTLCRAETSNALTTHVAARTARRGAGRDLLHLQTDQIRSGCLKSVRNLFRAMKYRRKKNRR